MIGSGTYLHDWGWAARAAGSGRHRPGLNAELSYFRVESLVLHTQFKHTPFRGDWMSFQLWDLLQDTGLCEGAGLGRDCERDALFNLHPLKHTPWKRKIISSLPSGAQTWAHLLNSIRARRSTLVLQTAHKDLDFKICCCRGTTGSGDTFAPFFYPVVFRNVCYFQTMHSQYFTDDHIVWHPTFSLSQLVQSKEHQSGATPVSHIWHEWNPSGVSWVCDFSPAIGESTTLRHNWK